MEEPSSIEGLVFEISQGTRSLGAERGTDLLLLLVYLRWRLRDDRDSWVRLHDAGRGLNQLRLLEQLTEDLIASGGERIPLLPFVEDDGKALHWSVAAMTRWGPDAEAFEAVLSLRRRELSKTSVDHETADEIAELMVACLPGEPTRVLDPACGIGTCLLAAYRARAHANCTASRSTPGQRPSRACASSWLGPSRGSLPATR